MNTERDLEAGKTAIPLTRKDVEELQSKLGKAAQLDLHAQNLQQIDLSYMDLQGANLQGADLQGANLRGTNLSGAQLQGANISWADLDGADLSRAHLGENEANRVKLSHARLSYATLRELDLRGFDLAEIDLRNADLNGTDLREAVLRGADLQGADLSTARLNGPELRGAILHRSAFLGNKGEQGGKGKIIRKPFPLTQAALMSEQPSLLQEHEGKQTKQDFSDREAYLFGKHTLLVGSDPAKLHELFPQGFGFEQARRLFDAWLVQVGGDYSEQAVQAIWIGFAHRICDLYYEGETKAQMKKE